MVLKNHSAARLLALVSFVGIFGCASESYHFGLVRSGDIGLSSQASLANTLHVGGTHPQLDRLEASVHWPGKLLRKVIRKKSPTADEIEAKRQQSIELAQQYLQANELGDIDVDVRLYAPTRHWQRIQDNPRIAPLWKATGGTLSFIRYSVLPSRILHIDHYDPFSNTLSLNSAKPTRAIYEAASAKQYRRHSLLGTYAALQYVPLVPLYHHLRATQDVLTYARVTGQKDLEHELYPTSYSRLGSVAVSETLSLTPLAAGQPIYTSVLMRVGGGVAGKVAGNGVAARKRIND